MVGYIGSGGVSRPELVVFLREERTEEAIGESYGKGKD